MSCSFYPEVNILFTILSSIHYPDSYFPVYYCTYKLDFLFKTQVTYILFVTQKVNILCDTEVINSSLFITKAVSILYITQTINSSSLPKWCISFSLPAGAQLISCSLTQKFISCFLSMWVNPNQICIVPFGTLFSKTVFKH